MPVAQGAKLVKLLLLRCSRLQVSFMVVAIPTLTSLLLLQRPLLQVRLGLSLVAKHMVAVDDG